MERITSFKDLKNKFLELKKKDIKPLVFIITTKKSLKILGILEEVIYNKNFRRLKVLCKMSVNLFNELEPESLIVRWKSVKELYIYLPEFYYKKK